MFQILSSDSTLNATRSSAEEITTILRVKNKVIECVDCGSGGSDLQFWITVGALVIAFLALLMNFVQFRQFMRNVRSRAEFKVTLHSAGRRVEEGVQQLPAMNGTARVAIGIKNEGKKAAGETLVNALIPRYLQEARWCGPNGQKVEAPPGTTPTDDEMLIAPDGTEYPAKYLSRMLPRVGTKPHHLLHFQFSIELAKAGDSVVIPVRVKVQADEIPDDVEDYIEDLAVRIERRPN